MGHSKELNRSCKVSKRFLSGSLPQCMRGYKTSALAYSYPNFHLPWYKKHDKNQGGCLGDDVVREVDGNA